MFRSRFFWRLYASYSALVLVTAVAIGFLIQRQLLASLTDEIQARLFGQAVALMPVAERAFSEDITEALRNAVDAVGSETGSRLTLIDPRGLVLADSEEEPDRMENHADRPEFIDAMRTGFGTSSRFSHTLQMFQLYVARAVVSNDSAIGVVRVSIPLADVDAQLSAVRWQIVRGAALGIILASGLGFFVARRLTAPITEMTRVSEALRRGEYQQRVEISGSDEISTLGETLNRLADELTDRISMLADQGAQLNAMLLGMQEGVLALDEHGRIAFTNRSARELLGLDDAEAAADPADTIAHIEGLASLIAQVRHSGTLARRELRLPTGDDEIVLDARATPFGADGESGVLLVLYNITNLRRLERVRTDFVANVSHELKTPLTSIQGYVETLLDGAVHDPDNNIRFLEKIEQHVRRLSALVTDLLGLARIEIETAAHALRPVAVDLHEVVNESVARRGDPIMAKQLELTVELDNELTTVLAEQEGMRQIVDNLLDNAINYTPDGGAIRIRVGARDAWGEIEIADTGIGIPPDAMDRIFERFYRVDRGRSRALGGTGLGLSIVRNLVQKMRGSVSVQSEVGVGSTFTVSIPLAPRS